MIQPYWRTARLVHSQRIATSETSRICGERIVSGLIALENDTKLLVMRDSLENYNGELEAIDLEAGDVLIFHALLIHAGSAYSKTNRRLHFTALGQRSMRSRPINETYVV